MAIPDEREQQLQDEIRKRILEAAHKKADQVSHTEETQATLDALEGIIDLPRAEMEQIAKMVEEEFKDQQDIVENHTSTLKYTIVFYSTLTFLVVATHMLIRRGSWLSLPFGGIAIVMICIKWKNRNK